jgi:hypothetical protein
MTLRIYRNTSKLRWAKHRFRKCRMYWLGPIYVLYRPKEVSRGKAVQHP